MIAALAAAFVVGLNGAGGAVPGMTAAQVSRAWHVKVTPHAEFGLDCATALVRVDGAWGTAIFQQGRFRSVFLSGTVATDTGVRLGGSVADLRKAYGKRLTSQPDKYVPGARTYFVKKRWQLRFDVSKQGRVTRIGFGDATVRLVEGCA